MVKVKAEVTEQISYVMYHNSIPVIDRIRIFNDSENTLRDISVTVGSEPGFLERSVHVIDSMDPGSDYVLESKRGQPEIAALNPTFLSEMTERMMGNIKVEVSSKDGEILTSGSYTVAVHAYDEWPGHRMTESIAAFVMPNATQITTVRSMTSKILREWGKSPDLEGYQSEDRNRVLTITAAVYSALERLDITYINPPASFEETGQRIRLPGHVLDNREGTCIDLAVLFSSVLESIGINSLIIFTKGHAFAGSWLLNATLPEIVTYECSNLTVNVRNGDLCVIECTDLTSGRRSDFEASRRDAMAKLENFESFVCAVDIARSRNIIRPMPTRVLVDDKWVVEREERRSYTTAPEETVPDYVMPQERVATKKEQWERKLLDITSNNALISLRMTKRVLPLLIRDLEGFENTLADGKEFAVKSKPVEWDGSSVFGETPFETGRYIGNYNETSSSEIGRHMIRTPHTEGETETALKSLYRAAKKEMEENGSNSLYVALGVLKWYEGNSSGTPRYAPLILIPVEIVRKPQKGYVIRQIDEDVLFNTTLSEMLRIKHEITIPGMEPLPEDDSGIDIQLVLQTVRKCISIKNGWDVMDSAVLGLFSFKQFVMWKDLNAFSDKLADNKIVNSLMNSRLMWEPEQVTEDGDPYDTCITVPADSSQVIAIKAAGNGKSFVLHGPPGTGKSQTITNIISNALYQGKTVLFVAEKLAALEVVQRRLDAIGIGNHCLEMHSNKSEKAKVVRQLKDALEECKAVNRDDYERNIKNLKDRRDDLDQYVSALHRMLPCGMSMYDAISLYESYTDGSLYPDMISLPVNMIPDDGKLDMQEIEASVDMLVDLSRTIDFTHPVLRTVRSREQSLVAEEATRNDINTMRREAGDVIRLKRDAAATDIGIDVNHPDYTELVSTVRLFDMSLVSDTADISIDLAQLSDKLTEQTELLERMKRAGPEDIPRTAQMFSNNMRMLTSGADSLKGVLNGMADIRKTISGMDDANAVLGRASHQITEATSWWKTGIFGINETMGVASKWNEANGKGFLGKGKAKKDFMSLIQPYLVNPMAKFEDVPGKLPILDSVRSSISDLKNTLNENFIADLRASVAKLNEMQTISAKQYGLMRAQGWDASKLRSVRERIVANEKLFDDIIATNHRLDDIRTKVRAELESTASLNTAEECLDYAEDLLTATRTTPLADWGLWNECCEKLVKRNLGTLADCVYDGLDTDKLKDSFFKAFYKLVVMYGTNRELKLRMFNKRSFEDSVERFKKMDRNFMELNKSILKGTLYQRLPAMTKSEISGTEQHILHRAINSTRMKGSVRALFSSIPNLLMKLCPCMLMSPLSASQYLSPDMPKFDLIVFDEASQIPTYKAISALARGKDAIVVGDPKQLPPTTFFQSKTETDEEEEELEDMESFLDDCLALPMPQTYLQWHYRSNHESLIEFSNRTFYDGKMYTFPSPNDLEAKVYMRLVKGVYERSKRINQVEAEAVVNEIIRRLNHSELRKYSIGVVALNMSQQNLIEDLLFSRIGNDPKFSNDLYGTDEPIFIKNLENVQGDERDVILFSIGYGPDKAGKVLNNFGPINRTGGGRRLNVAVSRARYEMIIFSSMTSDNISSSLSEGVKQLKEFLRFAQAGGCFDDKDVREKPVVNAHLLKSIGTELKNRGYEVHYNVGSSVFKVDIAVLDPRNKEKYIIGILTDGDSYMSSNNTRDREFARQDVLSVRGWKLVNVWSMEWHYRKDAVMQYIEDMISAALDGTPETVKEDEVPADEGSFEETLVERETVTSEFKRDYVPMDQVVLDRLINDPAIRRRRSYDVAALVLHEESPMTEERLISILYRIYHVKRLSDPERKSLERTLRSVVPCTSSKGYNTYWEFKPDLDEYDIYKVATVPENRRTIDDVPFEEIVNAVVACVRECGNVDDASVVGMVTRELGYERSGAKIKTKIGAAFDHAKEKGLVVADAQGKVHTNLK